MSTRSLTRLSRIVALGLLLSISAPVSVAESITVSAAVSLREAVTDAGKAFEADTGNHVEFTFGGSGQLAAQIENGAPVDAFISAANRQVDDLSNARIVDGASRRVIAGNSLVLIVPPDAHDSPSGFAQLNNQSARKIAVGEPKTVPAGQYAMQVLKSLKLDEVLASRLVYGANVRQVLDYVQRGEVAAGIVYLTDAKIAGDKVKVVATADVASHDPIVYPAVLITRSSKKVVAARFLEYLSSEKGSAAFCARGFTRGADVSPATAPAR